LTPIALLVLASRDFSGNVPPREFGLVGWAFHCIIATGRKGSCKNQLLG